MNLFGVIALLSSSKEIVDYLKLLIIWHEIMSFFSYFMMIFIKTNAYSVGMNYYHCISQRDWY